MGDFGGDLPRPARRLRRRRGPRPHRRGRLARRAAVRHAQPDQRRAAYAIGTQADRTSATPRWPSGTSWASRRTCCWRCCRSRWRAWPSPSPCRPSTSRRRRRWRRRPRRSCCRELRSLGFGILACGNAVGDMLSSVYVGWLLQAGRPGVRSGSRRGAARPGRRGCCGISRGGRLGRRSDNGQTVPLAVCCAGSQGGFCDSRGLVPGGLSLLGQTQPDSGDLRVVAGGQPGGAVEVLSRFGKQPLVDQGIDQRQVVAEVFRLRRQRHPQRLDRFLGAALGAQGGAEDEVGGGIVRLQGDGLVRNSTASSHSAAARRIPRGFPLLFALQNQHQGEDGAGYARTSVRGGEPCARIARPGPAAPC